MIEQPQQVRSLWWDLSPAPPARPALVGTVEFDIAIIGGGLTGLWTAYYLATSDPGLRICVVEADKVGFGASGRNGGWCSALFPAEPATIAAKYGTQTAIAMQQAMHDTLVEIERVCQAHDIDCDWAKGGTISLARTSAQVDRAAHHVYEQRKLGFGEADYALLDATAATHRLHASNVLGASYTRHCAAIDPLKLVRALAELVTQVGVTIFERTEVTGYESGRVETKNGVVMTQVVVRATEAYTARLAQHRRETVPVYSLMIATEPLSDAQWDEIGLAERETFTDYRHLIIYGQRTADNRIAFGGRGAPYHWNSVIRTKHDANRRVFAELHRSLIELLPQLRGVQITHSWGGPLGINRDWWPSVTYDPATAVATAGGYVGDGVSTTNLAGRSLAAMITGRSIPELALPWVSHQSPSWEPEPLRWLGANAALAGMKVADVHEHVTGHASPIADFIHKHLRS